MSQTTAARYTEGLTPDMLIGGNPESITVEKVTLKSGAGALTRGTVLGRVVGAVSAPVALGTNTGNGTFLATPTVGARVIEGDYKLVIIEPGTNAGVFTLEDPEGHIVGRGTVGVAFSGQLAFTLQDGSTDFVSGDAFTITVAVGTKYLKAIAAAADGSHRSQCILADDADATSGDAEAMVYRTGQFQAKALTFGTGLTASTELERLRRLGIHLVGSQEV